MTKVYVVLRKEYGWEGDPIEPLECIFSTQELAEQYVGDSKEHIIEEWDLDKQKGTTLKPVWDCAYIMVSTEYWQHQNRPSDSFGVINLLTKKVALGCKTLGRQIRYYKSDMYGGEAACVEVYSLESSEHAHNLAVAARQEYLDLKAKGHSLEDACKIMESRG